MGITPFAMNTTITAPDLQKTFPRSGRDLLGGYAFLARTIDKVRAEHAGTQGEYIGYCPFSMGFLRRAGITKDEFDQLIRNGASDDEFVRYFDERVSPENKEAANRYVLDEMADELDAQDAEEGRS